MTPEQETWGKAVALSLMMMAREQQRPLVHTTWDQHSRTRQHRVLFLLALCVLTMVVLAALR